MGESTEGYRGRIPRTPPRYVRTFNNKKPTGPDGRCGGPSRDCRRNITGTSKDPPKESQRNIRKETHAESQRNPRDLKVISKEPQRSSTGITKDTARNLRNLEDAGSRLLRPQSLLRPHAAAATTKTAGGREGTSEKPVGNRRMSNGITRKGT